MRVTGLMSQGVLGCHLCPAPQPWHHPCTHYTRPPPRDQLMKPGPPRMLSLRKLSQLISN